MTSHAEFYAQCAARYRDMKDVLVKIDPQDERAIRLHAQIYIMNELLRLHISVLSAHLMGMSLDDETLFGLETELLTLASHVHFEANPDPNGGTP